MLSFNSSRLFFIAGSVWETLRLKGVKQLQICQMNTPISLHPVKPPSKQTIRNVTYLKTYAFKKL